MNKEALEKLLEQMPRLTDEKIDSILGQALDPKLMDDAVEDYILENRAIAQAQQEADAEWMLKHYRPPLIIDVDGDVKPLIPENMVQLPNDGELVEEIRRLADFFMLPQLREYAVAITNELLRFLREGR